MKYPGKNSRIPSTDLRDIVGTRICHANADADTDADTNEIHTETNMSPLTFGGGTYITQTVLMLQSGHEYVVEMAIFNVQMAITPKVCNPGLRIWRSARRLMVLIICVNIHENILNVLKLQSGHEYVVKIAIFQCSKGNNSKRMQSRVMVLALCIFSYPP